jgi:acyl-CoA thioester hydrolase
MGHVNNAVYLSYFEQARVHFFRKIVGQDWNWNIQGILVARSEIDYKSPVHFNDQIGVSVEPIHIGNTSFTLQYELTRLTEPIGVCALGKTVQVCFDYQSKKKVAVPELWRNVFRTMMEK